MTQAQSAAFVMAQTVAAMAKLEGMKHLNAEYKAAGHPPAFNYADFEGLADEFGLGHNTIMALFNDSTPDSQ